MELIVFLSPAPRTGSSTIAHYLANTLVEEKSKELVLVIEWTKYTGRSIFLNSNTTEHTKQLASAVFDKDTLSNNLCTSKYNRNVYYLCQSMFSSPVELNNYLDTSIIEILKEVKALGGFKYVILDLPAYLEPVKTTVLSKTFPFKINTLISVLDEDAKTFKDMKDLTEVVNYIGEVNPHNTTYVMNKNTQYYVDYLNKYTGTTLFPACNLLNSPYMEKMTDNVNRGDIYAFGEDKKFKEFLYMVQCLNEIVTENLVGFGLNFSKDRLKELQEGGYNILELKDKPAKKSKPPKQTKSKTPKPPKQPKPQKLKQSKNIFNRK